MAAVVRVKRSLDEAPLDRFVLRHKKRKLNNGDSSTDTNEDISTSVLKFAGTIQKEENLLNILKEKKLSDLEELKLGYKKHTVDITEKLRLQHQEDSRNSRYKIVNCFRSGGVEKSNGASKIDSDFTILDVEADINQNDAKINNKNDKAASKYVYDLYYISSDDFGDNLNEYVSISPLNELLIFGTVRDNGFDESDSDISYDSNAEGDYRNDYPDEDDMQSITEDDMAEAMHNIELSDLSSDDGEDEIIYGDDSDDDRVNLKRDDVHRYGKKYAIFKAKYLKTKEDDNDEDDCYSLD